MLSRKAREAMNSQDQHDLVRLAAAANPFLAHIWEQALQREGIRCQVLGDYLDAGFGDIPGMMAEVWVEPADLARAEAILRHNREHSEEATQPEENS
jgi:Putative prokaryotic signal transducing protein